MPVNGAIMDVTSLQLREKIGQMFVIGISGPAIDDNTARLLDRILPGGVCHFARNIKSIEQIRSLNEEISERLKIVPMLSIDQEGGLVDRLRRLISPMPAASALKDAKDVAEFAKMIGEVLRLLGFNTNFAPVVDVINVDRSSVQNGLQTRNFGSSAEQVVEYAEIFLNELHSEGIVGCLKHFPGLGASLVDSHNLLPEVNVSFDEFSAVDLAPYHALIGQPNVNAVMVAHAAYPLLDLQETDQNGRLLPSSLSHNMISKLLRNQLGFDGVVITDDLEMGAIINNYGIGEASVMAVEAGVDMLAICAGEDSINEGYEALLGSVLSGRITEQRIDESLNRIFALKKRFATRVELDLARINEISDQKAVLKSRLN